MNLHHAVPCPDMRDKVKLRQYGCPYVSADNQCQAADAGNESQQQVSDASCLDAETHYDGLLAADAVLVTVTEIVYHEQSIDDKSAGHSRNGSLPVPVSGLYVIGKSHGNQAEEHQYQQVAPSAVRK